MHSATKRAAQIFWEEFKRALPTTRKGRRRPEIESSYADSRLRSNFTLKHRFGVRSSHLLAPIASVSSLLLGFRSISHQAQGQNDHASDR